MPDPGYPDAVDLRFCDEPIVRFDMMRTMGSHRCMAVSCSPVQLPSQKRFEAMLYVSMRISENAPSMMFACVQSGPRLELIAHGDLPPLDFIKHTVEINVGV